MYAFLLLALAAAPEVRFEGDLIKAASLTTAELAKLETSRVDWTDKRGAHSGVGVRLDKVLLHLGFGEGATGPKTNPKVKHAGLRAAVIATAPDGFEAVFSVGELLETLGATTAFLVWEMDGKPLPPELGPYRLVVATDKGSSRSIHQVVKVRVVDLSAGSK